jgi:hypothetical protein
MGKCARVNLRERFLNSLVDKNHLKTILEAISTSTTPVTKVNLGYNKIDDTAVMYVVQQQHLFVFRSEFVLDCWRNF